MKQHSTKVFRDIVNALGSFIQSLFIVPNAGNTAAINAPAGQLFIEAPHMHFLFRHFLLFFLSLMFLVLGGSGAGPQGTAQGGPGPGGSSGNLTTQAAFEYRGTWIPLLPVSVQGSAKAT